MRVVSEYFMYLGDWIFSESITDEFYPSIGAIREFRRFIKISSCSIFIYRNKMIFKAEFVIN